MEMENLLIQVCYDLKFPFVSLLFLLKSCAGICPGKQGKKIKCTKKCKVTFPLILSQSETFFKAAIIFNWTVDTVQ